MGTNDLQAIVTALSNGSQMSELTKSVDKCLLPIANKPMIFFPLFALENAHFTEVIIICTKSKQDKIHEAIGNSLKIKIEFFNIPSNEDIGTADALRSLDATKKIKTDFILINCDSFISFPLVKMINTYRTIDPTVAILMSPINITTDTLPGSKDKFNCSKHLIAIDSDNDNRILFLDSDANFDDELSLYSPMITKCTNFCVLNDLIDCHVYIFKKWILGYLKQKLNFRSVKDELIPKLISNQFKAFDKDLESKEASRIWEFYERDKFSKALDNVELKASDKTYNPIKCIAYMEESAICMRCNEISTYFEANHIARKLLFSPIKTDEPTVIKISCKEINDSIIDNSVIYGEKCSINCCNIGKGCKIGKKTIIQHCVIGENVVIKEGANIQSSIIANGAHIGQNAEIKQCIIAAGKVIVDLSKLNQEVIVDSNAEII